MDRGEMKVEWRYASTAGGAQSVGMDGTILRQTSRVEILDTNVSVERS